MKKSHIIIFVSIILIIQFLTHFVVYQGIVISLNNFSHTSLNILGVVFVLLSIAFVVGVFITAKYNNIFTRVYYKFFAIWQGFLLYFFIASSIYIVSISLGIMVSNYTNTILLCGALFVGIYGVINARKTVVKKVQVPIKNLPEVWKNKKVVWISDLHLGQINAINFAKKVVDMVNSQDPDIVFIGGDLYDGVKVDTEKIIEPLRELKTTGGVYFITGNHDGFTEISTNQDIHAIEKIGIKILRNKIVIIDGVQIVGVDYRSTIKSEDLMDVLRQLNIDSSKPSILLKHVPDHVNIASLASIDFMISGHTHRAQMWPLSYLPKLIYKGFDYGLKVYENMQVYTSSGVGTWGPPLRVGSKSEIVLINFV